LGSAHSLPALALKGRPGNDTRFTADSTAEPSIPAVRRDLPRTLDLRFETAPSRAGTLRQRSTLRQGHPLASTAIAMSDFQSSSSAGPSVGPRMTSITFAPFQRRLLGGQPLQGAPRGGGPASTRVPAHPDSVVSPRRRQSRDCRPDLRSDAQDLALVESVQIALSPRLGPQPMPR